MSVNFWSPECPDLITSEPCICADYGDDPNGCSFCNGTGIYTTEQPGHGLNLSNSNARALLDLMGEDHDHLCGRWNDDDLSRVRQSLLTLCNSPKARFCAVQLARTEGNMIDCGRSPEYVETRLRQMYLLVAVAHDNGWTINFG